MASSSLAGSAASIAETNKVAKYADLASNYLFVPIAIETFGTWGKQAHDFVSVLGARISKSTGDPRATMFLRQRISVAIQRGNAISVLGTHRHLLRSHVDDEDLLSSNKISEEVTSSEKEHDVVEYRPVCLEWQKLHINMFDIDFLQEKSVLHGQKVQYMHSTAMPATVSVLGDGNCLYRSLSYIICGNQIYHDSELYAE